MDEKTTQPQDGETEQKPTSPLAQLPDHAKLDEWLGVHMARAAKEYDEALDELGRLNETANHRHGAALREIEELRPIVDAVIHGDKPLTPKVAKAWLRIMELEKKATSEDKAGMATVAGTYAKDDTNRSLPGRELATNPDEWAKRRAQPMERWPGLGEEEAEPTSEPKAKANILIEPIMSVKGMSWV